MQQFATLRHLLFILASVAVVAGCDRTTDKPGSVAVTANQVEQGQECEDDSDCVISCDFPEACCPEGCQCTNAYPKQVQKEIDQWKEANDCGPAGPPNCPSYDCPRPEYEYRAVCRDGTCEAESEPIVTDAFRDYVDGIDARYLAFMAELFEAIAGEPTLEAEACPAPVGDALGEGLGGSKIMVVAEPALEWWAAGADAFVEGYGNPAPWVGNPAAALTLADARLDLLYAFRNQRDTSGVYRREHGKLDQYHATFGEDGKTMPQLVAVWYTEEHKPAEVEKVEPAVEHGDDTEFRPGSLEGAFVLYDAAKKERVCTVPVSVTNDPRLWLELGKRSLPETAQQDLANRALEQAAASN